MISFSAVLTPYLLMCAENKCGAFDIISSADDFTFPLLRTMFDLIQIQNVDKQLFSQFLLSVKVVSNCYHSCLKLM